MKTYKGGIHWATAGDSHGECLIGIIYGLPPGWKLEPSLANHLLAERSKGFGRSQRQSFENDTIEVIGGLWKGKTVGSPLLLKISNKGQKEPPKEEDWRVRPGHADFSGSIRTGMPPKAIAERASARETAIRTAMGGIALSLLQDLSDTEIFSYVESIGDVSCGEIDLSIENNLNWPNEKTYDDAIKAIKNAGKKGTTLGGSVSLMIKNLPPGIGESDMPMSKLSSRLGQALLSIPSIKGISFGEGLDVSGKMGYEAHDLIDEETNYAGGLEGGRTNGKPIIVKLWSKPISTQRKPLPSINLKTGEKTESPYIRSDVVVVPAISVIAKSLASLIILESVGSMLGRGTFEQWKQRWSDYLKSFPEWLQKK